MGVASFCPEHPVIFGNRDVFHVRMELDPSAVSAQPPVRFRVGFSASGYGMISQRPYQFGAFAPLGADQRVLLDVDRLRNAGSEPVCLTHFNLHCNGPINWSAELGEVRALSVSIKQLGTSSERVWERPPSAPTPPVLAPAILWGTHTGRAVVHRLPQAADGKCGWLLNPNESLRVTLQALENLFLEDETTIWVGMYGYAVVT